MKDEELKKLELLKEREDINEEVLSSVIKRIKMIKEKTEVKK
jgi:hypothetical protein